MADYEKSVSKAQIVPCKPQLRRASGVVVTRIRTVCGASGERMHKCTCMQVYAQHEVLSHMLLETYSHREKR